MGRSLSSSSDEGLFILVVEDSALIADKLSRVLSHAGAKVVGPVATVTSALDALGLTALVRSS